MNWPRYGWKRIDPQQPKLPALLRQAGYYTGLVLDTGNNVGAGLHIEYDEYRWIKKPVTDDMTPDRVTFPVPREHLRQNGTLYARDVVTQAHYRHERDWFVARTMQTACDWLEEHAARPFFLWVDTFEIHELWNPPAHYIDLYSRNYQGLDYAYPNYGYTDIYTPEQLERMRARYAGEVTLTDRWVGHLLQQIDYMGLFENTTTLRPRHGPGRAPPGGQAHRQPGGPLAHLRYRGPHPLADLDAVRAGPPPGIRPLPTGGPPAHRARPVRRARAGYRGHILGAVAARRDGYLPRGGVYQLP